MPGRMNRILRISVHQAICIIAVFNISGMQSADRQESDEALRQSIREFSRKEVLPIAARMDEEDWFPEELFRKLGKMGYLGITVPEDYGGSGLDLMAQAIIQEELGYASASLALSYGAHSNLCLDSLYRNGSEFIRKNYVPKLASGEWLGALCLTEPASGSDALAMKTTAEKVDGGYIINGSKTLITNAPYANLMFVYAKTDPGLSAFVVLDDDKGLKRGIKFNKTGMRGSPTGELFFDSLFVPEERLIGNFGKGKEVILSGLNSERAILAVLFVGIGRRALELAIDYAMQRNQGGKPISEYELIQEKLAYMYTKLEASKMLSYGAVDKVQRDKMNVLDSASSILYAAEVAEYISREAVQIFGGVGYTKDSEVERLLRDAILGQIGAGTTEIRKRVVSKALVRSFSDGWKP